MNHRWPRAILCFLLALVPAACTQGPAEQSVTPPAPAAGAFVRGRSGTPVGNYIKHVVIVVQENRSFDNFFSGYPGADSATFGYDSHHNKIPLKPVTFNSLNPSHDWKSGVLDWNRGKMDAFDVGEQVAGAANGLYSYAYVPHKYLAPYWEMANRYVLADRMFPTMFGASFTGHLTLIAGTADLSPATSEVDFPDGIPWGCDAQYGTTTSTVDDTRVVALNSGPAPCFTQFRTLADTLDAAGVGWRFYAPGVHDYSGGGQMWTSFDAIKRVRFGPDWKNVVTPQTLALVDPKHGQLAGVTWIMPDWRDSDHPGSYSNTGPSWVAAIVNAIGKSEFWDSTAIVVVWDDWGGWYDHVPPPQRDFRGLGIRVPCLIISPYAKHGYVSHTTYEYGSILHFVEDAFGLPPLGTAADGYTDARAASLTDSFDFTQPPQAFKPIAAPYPSSYFLKAKPSGKAPDEE